MEILNSNRDLAALVAEQRQAGKSIGFVPTMGALHAGHASLINKSKSETNFTVCSIFVNPTQFNDAADFERYPRTTDSDIAVLKKHCCDVLFLPTVSEIYPDPTAPTPEFDFGYWDKPMEGAFRPGHFKGMAQVVKRLLEIVQPDCLVMGQKDYQQLMIVRRLLAITALPVRLLMGETLREPDGLAMSSRNVRLAPDDRQRAIQLYRSLCWAKENFEQYSINELKNQALQQLSNIEGIKPEYFEVVDADTLQPIQRHNDCPNIIALVAAFLGTVRLIDNLFICQSEA
ncbi:MAG: pantoate--beta-alanine ligase [Sphingobacteriales bacterium]|nr:pantoate--beta-alanine ligase [Sphingobacteriales bacterium]